MVGSDNTIEGKTTNSRDIISQCFTGKYTGVVATRQPMWRSRAKIFHKADLSDTFTRSSELDAGSQWTASSVSIYDGIA
ncbi:hypothetical protein RRG08_014184 [Elysia crispata]|uniref:Uncharacterized protein n=1 Tax=Elysia crispata TaxID=231223 RepID=A0AAE1D949_9GAST|nr:hypothetical protein RRG08_014184 [Elysia crispata]